MNIFIQLTSAGISVGPFDLYSDIDLITPFASGVSRVDLLIGMTYTVDNGTTTILIQSTGVCPNSITVSVVVSTTSTTTSSLMTTSTTTTTTGVPTTTTTSTSGGSSTTTTTTIASSYNTVSVINSSGTSVISGVSFNGIGIIGASFPVAHADSTSGTTLDDSNPQTLSVSISAGLTNGSYIISFMDTMGTSFCHAIDHIGSYSFTDVYISGDNIMITVNAGTCPSTTITTTTTTTGYEEIAEYTAVRTAMTNQPSSTDKTYQNAWLKGLKDLGVLSKAIVLDNFAAHDSQSSLLNWKTPGTYNPTLFQSPVFTAYKGFITDATGRKNIHANFNPSVNGSGFLTKDDITIIAGINDNTTEVGEDVFCGNGTSQISLIPRYTTSVVYNTMNAAPTYVSQPSVTSKRYYAISRQSATQKEVYKNNLQRIISENSVSLPNAEMFFGGTSEYSLSVTNRTKSFVMIFQYLTKTEIQGVVSICDNYLKNYSTHLITYQTAVKFNLVLEGHSIIWADAPLSDAIESSNNFVDSYNSAQPGNNIATMASRASDIDSKLISETTTYKNILAVQCGINDVFNTSGQGLTAYNALKSYVQARVAAGWKVLVYTMTPANTAGRDASFEIERGIFNTNMRNDMALLSNVYVLDTDTISQLDDPADTTYYVDGIHLAPAGAILEGELFNIQMVVLYG